MLGAIYTGLSGMKSFAKGLQTISNNVANLNTPGFKGTTVGFADFLGSGVRAREGQVDFRQGDLRETGGALDLGIQGDGLLVLLDGGKTYFTRTGSFFVDEDGFISEQGTKRHLAVLDADNQPVAVNIDAKR